MKKNFGILIILFSIFLLHVNEARAAEISDAQILSLLDNALMKLPEKISLVPERIRRISFYALRVDKKDISRALFKQIQGKIEAKFLKLSRPTLVYAPEVRPVKVIAGEDGISMTTAFQETTEIKEVAQKLRLDGFIEGELCIAEKGVYLNLRIFDSESMAVVWSQSLDSTVPEEPPLPRTTGVDFGFGVAGLYLSNTVTTNTSIPQFANYYYADLRVSQKLTHHTRTRITLTGGLLYLSKGIKSDKTTIVSSSRGSGSFGFITSAGIRIPIIPMKAKAEKQGRDWLATEIKIGKIWGNKGFGMNIFGFNLECDITKNISILAGLSYAGTKTLTYASNSTVKAGGLLYEISLLRFSYRP